MGVVVDCTGTFVDPHDDPDTPGGSLRGHISAGARVVLLSAPFKSRQKNVPDPEDSKMMIYGINHYQFEPGEPRRDLRRFMHDHRPGAHDAPAP
ncbi:MAG: hypothetical protein MZV70_05655 [Desulfobacterales bacterium]|nr:hypothetical protein [Desulfobacterales bacterium]